MPFSKHYILIITTLYCSLGLSQKIRLNIPELNLCQSDTLKVNNLSDMAYSHYWTFCNKSSVTNLPTTTVLNHYNSLLNGPAMAEPVFDGSNYYLFITNYFNKKIIKANYGNSFLNTPTITDLGNIGGVLPADLEGLEIKKEGNNWIGFVTGSNAIVRINFGTDVNNNSPTATNLGNLGQLAWPHELHIFYHDNTWIGFVANRNNNSITRLVFGSSLLNTPTAYNFTNIGLTGGASGIEVKQDKNNDFYAFVTDVLGQRIVRLAFGKNISSNNSPTATTFNNLANAQQISRGILIIKGCNNEQIGYLSDENNKIIKLEFPNDLGGSITANNLGSFSNTVGKSNDLSDIIIQNDIAYFFSTNASGNTITRFAINMCSSSPQFPSQTTATPQNIKYLNTGKYIINYIMNPGEANEKDTCFEIEIKENCCNAKIEGPSVLCNNNTDTLKGLIKPKNATVYWYKNKQLIQTNQSKLLVSDTGKYQLLIVSNTPNCKDSFTFQLSKDTQQIQMPHLISLCNKDTVELKITGTNNVVWTPNKFINDTNHLKPIVFPQTDQKYYAKSKTKLGCLFYDSVLITKRNLLLDIGKDSSICEGDSILLSSNLSLSNYIWSNGSKDSFIVVNKSGIYHLFSKDSLNCIATDTAIITLLEQPNFELGNDTNICFPFSLNIGTFTYFKNLLWSTGDTSNIINVKESGTYRLTINKDYRCSFSDSISIKVNLPPKLTTNNDTSICEGDTIEIGTKQAFEKYNWLSGENTSTIKASKNGTYVLTVIDSFLCEAKDTITVSELPFPNLILAGDTIPCRNNYQITSTVNTPVLYEWNTGHKTSYINLTNGLSIKDPITYRLKVSNLCGEDIDSIKIRPCLDPIFFVPSAFSPNSNNLNEVFKIEGENLQWIKIEIYNRWGEKLFEQTGESPSWDGKYKQELCMEGIYLYMASIKAQNGKYFYLKGTLTLLR